MLSGRSEVSPRGLLLILTGVVVLLVVVLVLLTRPSASALAWALVAVIVAAAGTVGLNVGAVSIRRAVDRRIERRHIERLRLELEHQDKLEEDAPERVHLDEPEQAGRLDEAVEVLRRTTSAGDPSASQRLGELLAQADRPAEAAEAYRRAAEAYRRAGEVGERHALERALELLEQTSRLDEAGSLSASRPTADYETFYRREYRRVVGLVLAMTGARHVAEDIAHDAFVEALQRWDRVGQSENPGAWVRRTAMERAGRWHTRSLAEARALARGFLETDEVSSGTELSPEHAELWQAVRALPPRQAQVLVLYYQAGYSVAEIAETLGLAHGTVKAQLHYARRKLAKSLGADADFPRAD